MLVESGNPAHSLADSQRMREALSSLEHLVVIDVAMTETARLAALRAAGAVAVREVGGHVLQLRLPAQRVPPPPPAARAAAGHARRARDPRPPVRGARRLRRRRRRAAAGRGRGEPGRLRRRLLRGPGGQARAGSAARRTCCTARSARPCPTAPTAAAALWGAAHRCAQENPASVAAAGFTGEGLEPGERAVRRHPRQPVGPRVLGRRARGGPGPAAHRRRARPPRHPRAARRARRAGHRGRPGRLGRLPVRAVGRRAPLVHRQHDLPRPGVAEARRRRARCASAPPTPRRSAWPTATPCASPPSAAA